MTISSFTTALTEKLPWSAEFHQQASINYQQTCIHKETEKPDEDPNVTEPTDQPIIPPDRSEPPAVEEPGSGEPEITPPKKHNPKK